MMQCLEKIQPLNVLYIGHQLAQEFAQTAAERDRKDGNSLCRWRAIWHGFEAP
ncbi:hypothetical protein [Microcoleus sp. B3-D7]|uniref:hypothetical protein n=1 Tax=Microcoleus sp. B3-D7 TaxID=2818659 RepID=UPI002FD6850B